MELQSRLETLRSQGLGLAAISHDSRDILAEFAQRQRITFPLLSDPGSSIIKRYGLLNTTVKPDSPNYGIPFPGTFVLEPDGTVRSKYFEDAYQERNTFANIGSQLGITQSEAGTEIAGPNLKVTVSASDEVVAPGNRFSLVYRFEPGPNIHVYAPGVEGYRPLNIQVEDQGLLKVHPVSYPEPEEYLFKPLNERVKVYQRPFTIVQEVTLVATKEAQVALEGMDSLTIHGTISYQACDEAICFTPTSIPVRWEVMLRPLDRVRATTGGR